MTVVMMIDDDGVIMVIDDEPRSGLLLLFRAETHWCDLPMFGAISLMASDALVAKDATTMPASGLPDRREKPPADRTHRSMCGVRGGR